MAEIDVSFIIPCYRSERTLPGVVEEIRTTMAQRPAVRYEIVLVNDGSPDNVYAVICALAAQDRHIRGIDLARNFGQQAALAAGLRCCRGETAVCLDDDGQTPACETFALLDALSPDVDVVYASYLWNHKQHSAFRNFGSWMNESMLRFFLHKPKGLEITSFFAARRRVVEEIGRYTGPYPYTEGIILRAFKRIVNVPVTHRRREEGTSGYTFRKLLGLWLNGFTAFSIIPLRVSSACGAVCAAGGFIYMLVTIIHRFLDPDVPMGYSSLMAMLLFLCGIILMMLGMVGEYIGRMYLTMSSAPQYVVRTTTWDAPQASDPRDAN